MIVFRTDVSQYTVRSGPNGPGPHIRRVHFNRPDRYNFFREIRDFSCVGEGSPLVWHWPRGGEVTSADITSIEVHTPEGQVRYDPERDRLRRERRRQMWEDNEPRDLRVAPAPFTIAADSYVATSARTYEAELQRMRSQQQTDQRTARRQTWEMYLRGLEEADRADFINLVDNGLCVIECPTCIPEAASQLDNASYTCPLGMWEMELMEEPYENLIDMVRPPAPRPTRRRLADFTSPPEQQQVQAEDPFNHLPF